MAQLASVPTRQLCRMSSAEFKAIKILGGERNHGVIELNIRIDWPSKKHLARAAIVSDGAINGYDYLLVIEREWFITMPSCVLMRGTR